MKQTILKYETLAASNSPIGFQETLDTAKRINERTNGEVQVEVYGVGELVPESKIFHAVASGQLDMAYTMSAVTPGVLKHSEAVELPLWPSGQAGCAFAKAVLDKYIRPDMEALGVAPVIYQINCSYDFGYFTAPYYGQLWCKQMYASLEDAKGARIFAENEGIGAAVKAIGMTPVIMSYHEAYTALKENLIDGALMSPITPLWLKLQEIVRCCVKIDYPASGDDFTIMNKKTYDSLSADLRNIIIEEFKKWQMSPSLDRLPLTKQGWDVWNAMAKAGSFEIIELAPGEKAWCKQQWEQKLVDDWVAKQLAAGFKDAKAYLDDLLDIRDGILASGVPQYSGEIL